MTRAFLVRVWMVVGAICIVVVVAAAVTACGGTDDEREATQPAPDVPDVTRPRIPERSASGAL